MVRVVLVTTLTLAAGGSVPAVAQTSPATTPGRLPLTAPLFVPFPTMDACRAVILTNCFKFADNTVVGQVGILSPVLLALGLLRVPATNCTRIRHVGLNQSVVEVEAAAGFPLAVGAGSCDDVVSQVADHTAYLIAPGTRRAIPPTDGSVLEVNGSMSPRVRAGSPARP